MGILNLNRFNNKHLLVLAGNGMVSVAGLAAGTLLYYSLSKNEVGIWVFVQSIIAFCEAGRYGSLSTATVKFYAGVDNERAKTVLGSVWFLAIMLTGIVLAVNAIAFLFLPSIHDVETILCIKWVGLVFLCTLPSDVIFWRLQAEERYNTMLTFRIINGSLTVLSFAALMMLHKMTLEAAFVFNFLTNLFTSLIGICWGLAGLRTIRHRTKACIMEIVHYGKYTLGTTSGSVLLTHADTWIINFMLGPASVAIYNLAMRLVALVEMPLRSFAVTGMSGMAIAYNNNNLRQVTNIFQKYSGILTMLFIPVTLMALLFGDFAINLLGGPEYYGTEAAGAFKLVMVIALIYPIERLNGVTLDIIHKTKINFYKVVMMVTLKIVGDFTGITIFHNIYGIVFSILIVHVSALFYGNYQLQKYLDYTIPGIIKIGYFETLQLLKKYWPLATKGG